MNAVVPDPYTQSCRWQIRYLDGGILAAKAACLAFDLGDLGGGVEGGWLRALGELKDSD